MIAKDSQNCIKKTVINFNFNSLKVLHSNAEF